MVEKIEASYHGGITVNSFDLFAESIMLSFFLIISAGLIGFTLSKIIKFMLGKVG